MTRKITSHKGGRTERRPAVMTPETKASLDKVLANQGMSFGDWIEKHVHADLEAIEKNPCPTCGWPDGKHKPDCLAG